MITVEAKPLAPRFQIIAEGKILGTFEVRDKWRDFLLLHDVETGQELVVVDKSANSLAYILSFLSDNNDAKCMEVIQLTSALADKLKELRKVME